MKYHAVYNLKQDKFTRKSSKKLTKKYRRKIRASSVRQFHGEIKVQNEISDAQVAESLEKKIQSDENEDDGSTTGYEQSTDYEASSSELNTETSDDGNEGFLDSPFRNAGYSFSKQDKNVFVTGLNITPEVMYRFLDLYLRSME